MIPMDSRFLQGQDELDREGYTRFIEENSKRRDNWNQMKFPYNKGTANSVSAYTPIFTKKRGEKINKRFMKHIGSHLSK